MDASKSGLILAKGIFEKDRKEFGGGALGVEDTYFGDPQSPAKRRTRQINPASAAFILNKLYDAGLAKGEKLKKDFNEAAKCCSNRADPVLVKPYDDATEFANRVFGETRMTFFTDDLSKIRRHVDQAYEKWAQACGRSKSKLKKSPSSSGNGGDNPSLEAAKFFASSVDGIIATSNVDEIKASYAYRKWPDSPFAFQVAFGQLCEIKARAAKGGIAPCIREIDEMKTIVGSCVKAVEKSYID